MQLAPKSEFKVPDGFTDLDGKGTTFRNRNTNTFLVTRETAEGTLSCSAHHINEADRTKIETLAIDVVNAYANHIGQAIRLTDNSSVQ